MANITNRKCPNCGGSIPGVTDRYCDAECTKLAYQRRQTRIPKPRHENYVIVNSPVPENEGGFPIGARFTGPDFMQSANDGNFDTGTIFHNIRTDEKYTIYKNCATKL